MKRKKGALPIAWTAAVLLGLAAGVAVLFLTHAGQAAEGLGQLSAYGMDQPVVTMCGDSTFFHTVLPGLCNASYHNSNMTLIVLDNSATAMTGFPTTPSWSSSTAPPGRASARGSPRASPST